MKKVVIIGGRGNGTVIASAIEDINKVKQQYDIVGFLNDGLAAGETLNDYPVLGPVTKEMCDTLQDCYFIYSLISVKKASERIEKLQALQLSDEQMISIIHPSAVIGSHVEIGKGVVIMPNVTVSPNAIIGDYVQIYANSVIGHDTTIEPYAFISNSSSIGSFITVKEGAHIGSNCTLRERITVGEYAVIGMGSVVLKDALPYTTNVGVPSKEVVQR